MVVTPGHLLAVDASSFDVSIVDSFHGEENDSRSDGAKNNTLALGIVAPEVVLCRPQLSYQSSWWRLLNRLWRYANMPGHTHHEHPKGRN